MKLTFSNIYVYLSAKKLKKEKEENIKVYMKRNKIS